MADKSYLLDIVTPEKKVFSERVTFAIFPGAEGELGVLVDHAPLLSRLNAGEIRITRSSGVDSLAISGGFLEVRKNEVSVIAESAEFANQIDIDRARSEKATAEAELKQASTPADKKAAELRFKQASVLVTVAEKATKTPQEKH